MQRGKCCSIESAHVPKMLSHVIVALFLLVWILRTRLPISSTDTLGDYPPTTTNPTPRMTIQFLSHLLTVHPDANT